MATHSCILAWEIPWIEEPSGLHSMGLQRVGHNWMIEQLSPHHIYIYVCVCVCVGSKKLAQLIVETERSKSCGWQAGDPGGLICKFWYKSERRRKVMSWLSSDREGVFFLTETCITYWPSGDWMSSSITGRAIFVSREVHLIQIHPHRHT